MQLKREGSAVWRGTGKEGRGELTTQSGTLKGTQYSFATRFESGVGTNPEELLGAAHAGCFSMAFAFSLGAAGFTPEEIRTTAAVMLEQKDGGFVIPEVRLTLVAKIPGIANDKFQEIAAAAKANCPVSKLFTAKITLQATLA